MKIFFIFFAMLPGISFASGFGDEDANNYIVMFMIVWLFVIAAPLGFVGGFVSKYCQSSKILGFFVVSLLLSVLVLFLPGQWGVSIGVGGLILFFVFEIFMAPSFLLGWYFFILISRIRWRD